MEKDLPMKYPISTLALFGALAASPAWAQNQERPSLFGGLRSSKPQSSTGDTGNTTARTDDRVIPAANGLPELTPADALKPPQLDLPDEPIEPYLLTKDVGPFMVLARVFRGPQAERMALVLVKELRNDFHLPAYILRTKDYPGKSMIRGTPPTAPSEVMAPNIKMPEKIRTFDEAAVLVGNEKTLADSEQLWKAVKKLKPKCIDDMSTPFPWRKGLSAAIRTTNPYVPAQNLFARPKDRLVVRMNMDMGQRSVANCPGRYSLQIAEFAGRSAYDLNPQAPALHLLSNLHDSPLQKAAENAVKMAETLERAPEIQRLGQPIYVYHDRTRSKVFIGSFNTPQDPAAATTRAELIRNAVALAKKNERGKNAVDTMIVPALALTDLTEIKGKIKE
jgi:hypothetical protein